MRYASFHNLHSNWEMSLYKNPVVYWYSSRIFFMLHAKCILKTFYFEIIILDMEKLQK